MDNLKLYGAILGDLAGQPYEFKYKGDYIEFNIHDPKSHFTDDTLMTLASAAYMLGMFSSIEEAYKGIGNRYEGDYYGAGFKKWLKTPLGTVNNSWANGCLMRISPFMYADDKNKIIESCFTSHAHSESIIASLLLQDLYNFSCMRSCMSYDKPILNKFEKFDVTAKGTIDFIGHAYMYSDSTHETIEKVVKCGGDTDTNASIIGELMNYTFKDLTKYDKEYVESKLDDYLLLILLKFNKKFNK